MLSTRSFAENIWSESLSIGLALVVSLVLGIMIGFIGNPVLVIIASIMLVGGVITVVRPDVGLMVLVFIIYSRVSDNLIDIYNAPSVAKLFVPFMFSLVVWRWYFFNERPEGWGVPLMLLVAYGMWSVFSLLYAQRPNLAMFKITDYAKDALIALTVIMLMFNVRRFHLVIWTLIVVGLLVGTVSVYQYMTGTYTENYLGFGQADFKQITGEVHEYRIAGQIGDPNFYGQVMLVLVPLALDRFINAKGAFPRFIAAWATVATVLAIVFTFSRGAFVGMVIVISATMILNSIRPLTILAGGLALVVLLQFAPTSYFDRIETLVDVIPGVSTQPTEDASFQGRNDKANVAIQMAMDNPVIGVGVGNYRVHYVDYLRDIGGTTERSANDAHSLYLETAAEQGLIGLGILGSLIMAVFFAVRHARRGFVELGQQDNARMVAAFGLGFLGYIITAAFLHSAFPRFFWLLFAIGMALPEVVRFEREHVRQQLEGISAANGS